MLPAAWPGQAFGSVRHFVANRVRYGARLGCTGGMCGRPGFYAAAGSAGQRIYAGYPSGRHDFGGRWSSRLGAKVRDGTGYPGRLVEGVSFQGDRRPDR